jgi:type IV pilus assembly protein PilM
MKISPLFKDKPILGLDIGTSTIKVMQIQKGLKGKVSVQGYGLVTFDPKAIVDGVIVKQDILSDAIFTLFSKGIVGKITTRRAAISIPASKAFSRVMNLPPMNSSKLYEAVLIEAEQYIPVPMADLYIDYQIISDCLDADGLNEVLVVAVPKIMVDSYLRLMEAVDIETVAVETNLLSSTRLVSVAENPEGSASILVDIGSESIDVSLIDKTLRFTGTIKGGGDTFTRSIAKKLKISDKDAHAVKTREGLTKSKHQTAVIEAIEPVAKELEKEVNRIDRYYTERVARGKDSNIEQLITMGGGANMPGLSEYLIEKLRKPVRMCNPWQSITFGKLQPPHEIEKSMYITAAGLALVKPEELFSL